MSYKKREGYGTTALIRMDEELKEQVKDFAHDNNMSMSLVVETALLQFLKVGEEKVRTVGKGVDA